MSHVNIGSPNSENVNFNISQTDLLAGTKQSFIAPINGYIEEIGIVVETAVTTGGTLTVELVPALFATEVGLDTTSFLNSINEYDSEIAGTGSEGAVAGAVVTIANAAVKGTISIVQATPGAASTPVIKGQLVEVLPAGFATAGAVNGYIRFRTEALANGPSG